MSKKEAGLESKTDDGIALEISTLQKELDRRKKVLLQAKVAESKKLILVLQKELNQNVLDALVPKHSMTTCSDNNLKNGLDLDYNVEPSGCARCCLLEIIHGEADWKLPDSALLSIHVSIRLSKH